MQASSAAFVPRFKCTEFWFLGTLDLLLGLWAFGTPLLRCSRELFCMARCIAVVRKEPTAAAAWLAVCLTPQTLLKKVLE